LQTGPTPYLEVNALLNLFLPEVQAILENQFTGMYLHGSLAYGDFNPETSDIDFLAVTEAALPPETFSALKDMHARLFRSGLACSQKLEGAYLPKKALRRHNPDHTPVPWLGEDGHFALEGLGSDWIIQRWILREKGSVVAGPPLAGLIDPVSPEDLRQAVRGSLREWWSPPFPSPQRFQSGAYQAYAILTMCRSLYVIENGRVASKPEAARWAMDSLGEPWRGLISAAAAWRPGMEFDKLDETLNFIRFTLGTCRPVL
jgi:predicted nucleotidyltransferase